MALNITTQGILWQKSPVESKFEGVDTVWYIPLERPFQIHIKVCQILKL